MSRSREARQKEIAKERRAENRDLARRMRTTDERRARIRTVVAWGTAFVMLAGATVGVGLWVQSERLKQMVGPANMLSDGLQWTGDGTNLTATTTDAIPANGEPTAHDATSKRSSGVIDFVLYVDYGDPASAAFWSTNGSVLVSATTGGYATLEIHPIAPSEGRSNYTATPSATDTTTATATPTPTPTPTDTASATPTPTPTPSVTSTPNPLVTEASYSRRAANAFACVASLDPSNAMAVNQALFAKQATFGAAGLTDDQLVNLASDAGASGSAVADCIRGGRYLDWVTAATQRAATTTVDGSTTVTSTPTVVVGGTVYTGSLSDQNEFIAFADKVYASLEAAASTASATPEATDGSTAGEESQATASATP